MKFIKIARKIETGFRVSPKDQLTISKICTEGAGSLTVDLLNIETGDRFADQKAIWSSEKIRLIDHPIGFDKEGEYVVSVKTILPRRKGERV